MSQLRFVYGPVASGKSLALLTLAYSLQQSDIPFRILVPALDTRAGRDVVWSRTGITRPAESVDVGTDLVSLHAARRSEHLIVDEAQFFAADQARQLAALADTGQCDVTCFGLLADFRNRLFPASEVLLVLADIVEQMHTPCRVCGRKAALNLRLASGQPVYDGESIQIGGDESYIPVCRMHYSAPELSALARWSGQANAMATVP